MMPGIKPHEEYLLDAAMLEIPVCTDEERYMQPTKWAVMKDGQKKAVKLFDRDEDAENYIFTLAGISPAKGLKYSITERKGGYMKCLWYCGVSGVCPHNKNPETPVLIGNE